MKKRIWVGVGAILFGLLTLKEGAQAIFVHQLRNSPEMTYVPFVVWFNFLSGFALIVTGVSFLLNQSFTRKIAVSTAAASWVCFFTLIAFIAMGGAHSERTPIAMTLRTLIWTGLAWGAYRLIPSSRVQNS